MNDEKLIDLFFNRDESAVEVCAEQYGHYLNTIAFGILRDEEDMKECVNDTYLSVWRSIPPKRPDNFKGYIGKIARNLSLDSLRQKNAAKRGGGQYNLVLEELSEVLATSDDALSGYSDPVSEEVIDQMEVENLNGYINDFLKGLSKNRRIIFLQRYWYMRSVKEIAKDLRMTESNVKTTLFRVRSELKAYLEKKGVEF